MLLLCACSGSNSAKMIREISEKYRVSPEKQLIVYTSHKEEVYLPIIREFENRTGIRVEVKFGGTAELFKEVREASGNGTCDILFGGGIESYEAGKDLFLPYRVTDSEILDPNYVSRGNYWTSFTELPLVFVYNNKLVSETQAPRTWADLFRPEFKGQIAFADLNSSGTSYTILSAISQIANDSRGISVENFIKQLDGRVLSSSGRIVPDVSDGTFLIGITLEETAKKNVEAGYDITMVYPEDGTVALPDGCAMVKNAPHSFNAGRFIDFVTGYDTQKYAMDEFYRRPIRSDMELTEGYPEIKLLDFDLELAAGEEEKIFALWNEMIPGEED